LGRPRDVTRSSSCPPGFHRGSSTGCFAAAVGVRFRSAREKRRTAGVLQFAKRARPRTRPVRETPREPKADADVERPGMRARARVCVASRASASAARARVSFNRFSKRFSDGYFRLPRQRAFDAQARSVPGLNRPMSVWIKISFDHLESKAAARGRTHGVDMRHAGTQNASSTPTKTGKGRADAQAGAHTRQPSRRTREMAL
jgi:hypothetical protein